MRIEIVQHRVQFVAFLLLRSTVGTNSFWLETMVAPRFMIFFISTYADGVKN